jgi:hypothetical protein
MSTPTFEPTQNDLDIARRGIMIQAEARGVVVTPEVESFIELMIVNRATSAAESRLLQNIIHEG